MPPTPTPADALKDLARSWQRDRRRVLRDPAPEAVHRLRTATRRLEVGGTIAMDRLGAVAPVPGSEWDRLKRRLSRLRDLDATCEVLQEARSHLGARPEAFHRLLKDLNHQRGRLCRRTVAALRRHRAGRVPRALKHVGPRLPQRPNIPVAAQAWWTAMASPLGDEPAWSLPLAEALRRQSGQKAIHAIRIRVRELRYGLEWWGQIGLAVSPTMVAFLQTTQDILGGIRDDDRAIKLLSGPKLRRPRAVVAATRATQLAHWHSAAEGRTLLGSSPFGAFPV